MMKIEVKYFGMIAETTGVEEENLNFEKPVSLENLEKRLVEKYPGLKERSYKLSLEKRLVKDKKTTVENDAEVALLPPFAGG